jgi:hypothetical protein
MACLTCGRGDAREGVSRLYQSGMSLTRARSFTLCWHCAPRV